MIFNYMMNEDLNEQKNKLFERFSLQQARIVDKFDKQLEESKKMINENQKNELSKLWENYYKKLEKIEGI